MRVYYQVLAGFKSAKRRGKPSLISLSLHSSSVFHPFMVTSANSQLFYSRFFHTVKEAENYITYLFSLYPNCGLPRPVLDASQPLYFRSLISALVAGIFYILEVAMYAPNFSQLAAVSVRRLAWAMKANMGQAVDVMVKALPAFINAEKVCGSCKDKSKCSVCSFQNGGEMPEKALPLLYLEVTK